MSLIIHICNNHTDADFVINTVKITSPHLVAEKFEMPNIAIRDHTNNVAEPILLSQGKVCVVFRS
ncbi:MAG: hypothetical protein Q7T85_00420 [Nitrosomonas sp.]|nr:hypothetical protein [Nitrosomonas sp.]